MPSFTFNAQRQKTTVDAHFFSGMPLLWVLRGHSGLTGTKFGCGRVSAGHARCTSTVRRPGRASRRSKARRGLSVLTIEGLLPGHCASVQRAWIQDEVPQCGYCQSGQIMTAVALLKKHPHPTDAEIDESMGNNLCRWRYIPAHQEGDSPRGDGRRCAMKRPFDPERREFFKVTSIAGAGFLLGFHLP